MARADKALQDIKALRPTSFTLDQLDQELLSMTLIRALPTEYNNFASSLLLLDSLDLNKLQSAFQNEESQRLARNVSVSSSSILLHLHHLALYSPYLRFLWWHWCIQSPIALKSRGHHQIPSRSANRGRNKENPNLNRMQRKHRTNLIRVHRQQLNLLAMQVLFSQSLSGLNGLNLEHALTGTLIQVPLHT